MGIDLILQDIFQGPPGFEWGQAGLIDIVRILLDIIKLLLILGNVAGAFFIAYSAFGYISAFGNEENAKKAKNGITAAITGVVIISVSYVLIHFLYGILVNEEFIPPEVTSPPN